MEAAIFLALVNERVIAYFIAPLFEEFWEEGCWLLLYIAALTGGLLSFAAGIDLMGMTGVELAYPVNLMVSAILVGGGSNLLHDVFFAE
ncbi:MAG: hypothetical protein H8D74_01140 [Chloroflexi bacterium]|nr:hypothetical protein [Chloroflexota bacterium]